MVVGFVGSNASVHLLVLFAAALSALTPRLKADRDVVVASDKPPFARETPVSVDPVGWVSVPPPRTRFSSVSVEAGRVKLLFVTKNR
jgi:hypothetical protein